MGVYVAVAVMVLVLVGGAVVCGRLDSVVG